jgi:STAS domain
MSGLRYADSASIRTLVLAARTLKERGASLVLLRPQPAVARILTLLGADQMLTILGQSQGKPQQTDRAGSLHAGTNQPSASRARPGTSPAVLAQADHDQAGVVVGVGNRSCQ